MQSLIATITLVVLAVGVVGCNDDAALPTSPTLSNFANTTIDGIRGQVRDTLGRPVDSALVEVTDGPLAGRTVTSGTDGRFLFASTLVATDLATLRITKVGFTPSTLRWRGQPDFFITLAALNLLDLSGSYTMVFSAAPSCSLLPAGVRSRTFTAQMSPSPTGNVFTAFEADLGGADFFPAYDKFWAGVGHDAARFSIFSRDAFNWWLDDLPIIERVGPTGFLAFMGTANAPLVQSPTAITAQFDGSISFCSALTAPARDNFPPTCAAPIECRSDRHQIRFLRR
jgi:hypothetical protein